MGFHRFKCPILDHEIIRRIAPNPSSEWATFELQKCSCTHISGLCAHLNQPTACATAQTCHSSSCTYGPFAQFSLQMFPVLNCTQDQQIFLKVKMCGIVYDLLSFSPNRSSNSHYHGAAFGRLPKHYTVGTPVLGTLMVKVFVCTSLGPRVYHILISLYRFGFLPLVLSKEGSFLRLFKASSQSRVKCLLRCQATPFFMYFDK